MESDPAASVELRSETFPCRRSHLASPPGPACPTDNVAANALFGAYQGYGDKPYNSPRDSQIASRTATARRVSSK